jgi:hypothetical protein
VTAAEIEHRCRAIILRAAGDDPMLRTLFAGFADDLGPDLARWASRMATPPDPEPLPPPTSAREEKRRARKARQELRELEAAIAAGKYISRDAAVATFEDALRSCCDHIRRGYQSMRDRRAAGELADDAAAVAFLDRVMEESIALLGSGLGFSMPSEGH